MEKGELVYNILGNLYTTGKGGTERAMTIRYINTATNPSRCKI